IYSQINTFLSFISASFDFSFDSGDQIGTHFRHIMHLCGKFCYRRDFHYVPCRRQSRRPTVANNGAYWFN
ncbi:MAG: hypothetical protein QGG25_14030, partial [Phycisphaerae bacterium]|nr:hypothetical protein [Phycisphaerae bacterium]